MDNKYISHFDIWVFLAYTIIGIFLGYFLIEKLSLLIAISISIIGYLILVHTQIKVIQFDFKTIDIWKVFVKKRYQVTELEKVTYYPRVNGYSRPILTFHMMDGKKFEVIEFRTNLVKKLFKEIENSELNIRAELAKR